MHMNHDSPTVRLLQDLGCNHSEAAVYEALLQSNDASIRKVAAASGVNRGTTYEALKHLAALGLVSVKSSGSRERYTAESPERIFDIIRDKRRELLEASAAAKRLVPDLLARKPRPTGQPMVRYYEGDDGIVAILRDVLQTCTKLAAPEYCAYSSRNVRQYLYRRFPQFTKRRIDQGIYVRVIAVGEGGEAAEYSERKFLQDMTHAELSSYTIIYGNKVATISTTDDGIPYGVVIEDGGAAAMQRLLFTQLWKYL